MKKLVAFALLVAAPAMAGFDDDEYHLVKITDRAKEVTYEVMDAEQLEELEAAIKLEKKFHTKAMMLASKEWRKNEELKRKAYPRGAIAARKVQKIGTYKDMDRAEDKKMYYEDKAADKVVDGISHFQCREEMCALANDLVYEGDSAVGGIGIGYGEGNPFSEAAQLQDDELAGLPLPGDQGRLDPDADHVGRQPGLFDYAVHATVLSAKHGPHTLPKRKTRTLGKTSGWRNVTRPRRPPPRHPPRPAP